MEVASRVWLNGKLTTKNKAVFFPFSQGINYGASIFEGIRVHDTVNGPAIFRLPNHLERFFHSAAAMRMKLDYSEANLADAIKKVIQANKITNGYIRPLAFYSSQKFGMETEDSPICVMILALATASHPAGAPIRVVIADRKKASARDVDYSVKISGYYASTLLEFQAARARGYDDVLFLDQHNNLAEASTSNIFVVRKSVIYTPSSEAILPGITRDTLITLAGDLKLNIKVEAVSPRLLKDADEVFLTGTGAELKKVKEVVGHYRKTDDVWPVAEALQQRYRAATNGALPEYSAWLTLVTP